jgi:hypothetical protein
MGATAVPQRQSRPWAAPTARTGRGQNGTQSFRFVNLNGTQSFRFERLLLSS